MNPVTPDAKANSSGSYLLLPNGLDADSIFKLAKYFLQILAGVINEEIVVNLYGKNIPWADT